VPPLRYKDIRANSPFPPSKYSVTVELAYLERCLESFSDGVELVTDPDFQRAHIWTETQQSAYMEYLLQDGPSARVIYWACDGWMSVMARYNGDLILVDGKQRLEAARKFMRDELKVFGLRRTEIGGHIMMLRTSLTFNIADIGREQTLRWYLALNAGGTPHTNTEIERVRVLLEQETK